MNFEDDRLYAKLRPSRRKAEQEACLPLDLSEKLMVDRMRKNLKGVYNLDISYNMALSVSDWPFQFLSNRNRQFLTYKQVQ